MQAFWTWITDPGNGRIVLLPLLFGTFLGIVFYLYGSPRRGRRLESYRHMPFEDEPPREQGEDGRHE
ncbi:MAG: cbb3-type cytochrome oxidase subunit 3 [Ectothiorhodospira sp.]